MSTLFRFAQYLGWSLIIYGYSDRLRFEKHEPTKKVARLIREFSWVLSDDRLDRTDISDSTTTQLMFWAASSAPSGN
jgi:hypothetical protein